MKTQQVERVGHQQWRSSAVRLERFDLGVDGLEITAPNQILDRMGPWNSVVQSSPQSRDGHDAGRRTPFVQTMRRFWDSAVNVLSLYYACNRPSGS